MVNEKFFKGVLECQLLEQLEELVLAVPDAFAASLS